MARQLADGFVVYDPRSERVHVLSESARFVWERCDGNHTAADAVAAVLVSSDATPAQAAEGVYHALRELLSNQLVVAL